MQLTLFFESCYCIRFCGGVKERVLLINVDFHVDCKNQIFVGFGDQMTETKLVFWVLVDMFFLLASLGESGQSHLL